MGLLFSVWSFPFGVWGLEFRVWVLSTIYKSKGTKYKDFENVGCDFFLN